jgi:hypothetical protein
MNCIEISCDPAVVNVVALAREKPALEASGKQRRSFMEKLKYGPYLIVRYLSSPFGFFVPSEL